MLNELAKEIHDNAVQHGFWEDGNRNFGETAALIHSEVSEALEEARYGNPAAYYMDRTGMKVVDIDDSGLHKMEGVAVELVDAMIRILDFMGHECIDVDRLIAAKMAYNKTRPYKHGKEF